MWPESSPEFPRSGEQGNQHLIRQVRQTLLTGTYDVLSNHHEDIVELSSGQHHYEHRLTREEAERLERVVWSPNEDQALELLLAKIQQGLHQAGFDLASEHADIAVHLRAVPPAP